MSISNPEVEPEIGQGENKDSIPSTANITLELGDIIEIHAPSNPALHNETFMITYLDETKIRLTNISTFHLQVLRLDKDGRITDESVHQIVLLSRAEERGYARQHQLLPKTWIDIHFGGDVPAIVTGEITNLEEDMIEITTYPDVETIYIDFAYKGIPEDIPIDHIVLRTKPAALEKIASMIDVREQVELGEAATVDDVLETSATNATMEWTAEGEAVIQLPKNATAEPSIREALHSMYIAANEIVYGEELEDIVQRVEIPEHQKKYGIETQVNDMLDELLSEIPNSKRTTAVLDNIHRLIERFRELRTQFSKFDSHGMVQTAKTLEIGHKPLVHAMQHVSQRLQWLMPVVALRRKLFTTAPSVMMTDVIQQNVGDVLDGDQTVQEEYNTNRMRGPSVPAYQSYYAKLAPSMTPVEPPAFPAQYLAPKVELTTALDTVVQNLENFHSTVLMSSKDTDTYARRRFVTQR